MGQLASEELHGRYADGERVAAWGNGAFAQADVALRPTFDDATRSLHFYRTCGRNGSTNLVLPIGSHVSSSGGFSIMVRFSEQRRRTQDIRAGAQRRP
jgi:hypothetical protein